MERDILKNKILDLLHATYLTGKYEEVKTRPRQRIHGQRDVQIGEILSIDDKTIMEAAKELQAEAMVDITPHDNKWGQASVIRLFIAGCSSALTLPL